jgi:hypothetical protein
MSCSPARRKAIVDEEGDDLDLTVCHFDPSHTAERVPSTRILRYGREDFMPACGECAAFFEQTDPRGQELSRIKPKVIKLPPAGGESGGQRARPGHGGVGRCRSTVNLIRNRGFV